MLKCIYRIVWEAKTVRKCWKWQSCEKENLHNFQTCFTFIASTRGKEGGSALCIISQEYLTAVGGGEQPGEGILMEIILFDFRMKYEKYLSTYLSMYAFIFLALKSISCVRSQLFKMLLKMMYQVHKGHVWRLPDAVPEGSRSFKKVIEGSIRYKKVQEGQRRLKKDQEESRRIKKLQEILWSSKQHSRKFNMVQEGSKRLKKIQEISKRFKKDKKRFK